MGSNHLVCVAFDNNVQDGDLCMSQLLPLLEAEAEIKSAKIVPGNAHQVRDASTGALVQGTINVIKNPSSTMKAAVLKAGEVIAVKTGANFCGSCGPQQYGSDISAWTDSLAPQSLDFTGARDRWVAAGGGHTADNLGTPPEDHFVFLRLKVLNPFTGVPATPYIASRKWLYNSTSDSLVEDSTDISPSINPAVGPLRVQWECQMFNHNSSLSIPTSTVVEAFRFKAGDYHEITLDGGQVLRLTYQNDLVFSFCTIDSTEVYASAWVDDDGQMIVSSANVGQGRLELSGGTNKILYEELVTDWGSGIRTQPAAYQEACERGLVI